MTRVFVASSSESLDIAYAVQENLERSQEVTVWDQGVSRPSEYVLESLLNELAASEYGVFVLTPTDVAAINGEITHTVRDNVILELGMFIGKLGRHRSFLLMPSDSGDIHLPSDLRGLTVEKYKSNRKDGNSRAAVAPACRRIEQRVLELSQAGATSTPIDKIIAKAGSFQEFDGDFPQLLEESSTMTLCFIHSRRWRETLNEKIIRFLRKGGTIDAYLPDLNNTLLRSSLTKRFDDGRMIPNFVGDAYSYFARLSADFSEHVNIYLFGVMPSYSFYKFDKQTVFALYTNSIRRKNVPTFLVDHRGVFSDFFDEEINDMKTECRHVSHDYIEKWLLELFENG